MTEIEAQILNNQIHIMEALRLLMIVQPVVPPNATRLSDAVWATQGLLDGPRMGSDM